MARMNKLILAAAVVALSGCAGIGGSDKPTKPPGRDARASCDVREGRVLEVIDVTIEGQTGAAVAIGGAVGGYAGSVATSGRSELTRLGGSIAGAAVGAIVGDQVSDLALDRSGTELIVAVGSRTVSVVQETDRNVTYSSGDDVWVIGNERRGRRNNQCGDIRVLPKTK